METKASETNFMYRVGIAMWQGMSLTVLAINCWTGIMYALSDGKVQMNLWSYAGSVVMSVASYVVAKVVGKKVLNCVNSCGG